MTVHELYRALDQKIPAVLRCEWDNDGLMCEPDPNREVKRVLFTLDVTDGAIAYAIENGADVIISHHPLVFRPIKALNGGSLTGDKLLRLVKADIAVFSFHTRLDRMEGGVNDVLAQTLGLSDLEVFGDEETPEIGRIGNVNEEETTVSEFAAKVSARLGTPAMQIVDLGKKVRRVAVVGGDGKDFIPNAIAAGVDLYLTGTLSYNSMIDAADMGLQLIEAGHYYTEAPVLTRLKEWVAALCANTEMLDYANIPIQWHMGDNNI